MNGSDNHPQAEDAREAAANWFARLQSDAADGEDWLAFETWFAADPAHQTAFEAVEGLWLRLDETLPIGRRRQAPVVLPLGPARRKSRLGWAALIAAALCVAVLLGARLFLTPAAVASQTYATGLGQRRSVAFTTGDRIAMNSNTRLVVELGGRERRVRLLGGEAAFWVIHDPQRAFVVTAGGRTIRDVGTIFDVSRYGGGLTVTVKSGQVAVGAGARPAVMLSAGQQYTQASADGRGVVRAVDAEAAMAWRTGKLVYHDQTLEVVAADLNQHFATPVRLKDAETAKIRFSGVLMLDSEDEVLRRLQIFLPIAVEQTAKDVVLRKRAPNH